MVFVQIYGIFYRFMDNRIVKNLNRLNSKYKYRIGGPQLKRAIHIRSRRVSQ